MGCDCSSSRTIKQSHNIYEFLDSLEVNITLLNEELRKLSSKSKDIFILGKRVIKVSEDLLEVLKKVESYDLMSTDWETMRDAADVCFTYYYSCFSSLNSFPTKDEENEERKFINAEKELRNKRKELMSLLKR